MKLDKRQLSLDKKENINNEIHQNTKDDDIRLLGVKNNRSISDLYTGANHLIQRADRKLICNTCDEVSNAAVIKTGKFSYNFENEEMDICEGKMSWRFRNLKPGLSPAGYHLCNSQSELMEKKKFQKSLIFYSVERYFF